MSRNLLGVHAGLWGFDWSHGAAKKTIAAAKNAGFGLIEIPAISSRDHEWNVTRQFLEEYDIDASVSLALDFESDINSTNPITSAKGEQRLSEAVDFAEAINARFVGGVTYSAMGRYMNPPTQQARENSLAVLRRIATKAKNLDITLGIEYVNRYETNLLNSAADTLGFIDELGLDNVVLHLDTFHAQIEEVNLNDAVTLSRSKLGYIHASESHRGVLGTGAIDWAAFIENIKIIDYQGPITVETFSSAVLSERQSVDIGLWNTKWTDPNKVAAETYEFLNSLINKSNN